ncbi:MAG: HAD family hydrolase [Treponema sp.]|nr:HAD family hydrolase [Treponema sp.]
MILSNLGEIKAVAFDIDGTLYHEAEFNSLIFTHFVRHLVFFSHFGLVRKELRKKDFYEDFVGTQAEMMAKRMHCSKEKAQEKLDKIVYSGLKNYFTKLEPCDGALDFIKRLKENGIKIALLSDFPPEQKGDIWGIKQYCDLCIGSEEIGGLKPSEHVFKTLQQKIGVPAEEILYIGNNHKYDVEGPKKTGMKAAWFVPSKKHLKGKKAEMADIAFCSYRTLEKTLFGNDNSEK